MLTVQSLRRRLNAELTAALLPAPAWIVATAFVAARLTAAQLALWIVAGATVGVIVWLVLTVRRQAWTERQAAMKLDRLADAGGLLLTLREVHDSQWQQELESRLRGVKAPPIQLRRPLLHMCAAAAFALIVWRLPLPKSMVQPAQQAALHAVDALALKEQALAKEQPLPPALSAELERLREEAASGRFDAADWEANDSMREALDSAAQERADALQSADAAAARLEDALNQNADAEAQAQEREALENALAALSEPQQDSGAQQQGQSGDTQDSKQGEKGSKPGEQKGQQGKNGQQKQGQQQAGSSKGQPKSGSGKAPTTPKDLQALRQALKNRQQQLAKQFPQNGTGRDKSGLHGKNHGQSNSAQNGGDDDETGFGPSHGKAPDTPIRFGDETKFQKDRLKYEAMPQGNADEDSGQLWGLTRGSPSRHDKPARIAGPSGVGNGDDNTPGGRAGAAPPRHRDLVQRYFNGATPTRTP